MDHLENKIFITKYKIIKHILADGICHNWHNLQTWYKSIFPQKLLVMENKLQARNVYLST